MALTQKITPHLWFNGNAEEAVEFYTSVFHDSRVTNVARWGDGGPGPQGAVMNIVFELAGQRFIALNGGPQFTFSPAISLFVSCESQAEVDELWTKLLAGGGKPNACGWLDDRYGVSWQIVPTALIELMNDPDPKASGRVARALMGMQKIEIASLRRAYLAA
ncbi:MAG TPA: VOC family protein [Vicinamibacterales bacterium]|nr:VOC family protein [Vicinamibacterales bacterium]